MIYSCAQHSPQQLKLKLKLKFKLTHRQGTGSPTPLLARKTGDRDPPEYTLSGEVFPPDKNCSSHLHRKNMSKDASVRIENGFILGSSTITARVAIQMIMSGAAEPASDSSIRLTFAAYIEAVRTPPAKERTHKESASSGCVAALNTVQEEPVYSGKRREGSPVTGSVNVLRKIKPVCVPAAATSTGGDGEHFSNWGENDTFPLARFNPDNITRPQFALFPTLRAYQLAIGA